MKLKANKSIWKFKQNFFRQFEKISKDNISLYKLLYEPSRKTNVFIVGGFLRSVINQTVPRDIDIIFNFDSPQLEEIFHNLKLDFKINKLGGYKIKLNTITIDAWTIHDNWAFKNRVISNYEYDPVNKIAEGTFFNFDSLVFDLFSERCNFKHYNDCVILNHLDIIRSSSRYTYGNPGKLNNVIRAFEIRRSTNLSFSIALANYIYKQISNTGMILSNELTSSIYNEAKKQTRFDKLHILDIEEAIQHTFDQIKDGSQNGEQIKLF